MPKVTPFLTFDHGGLEAVNFYLSLFKNSKLNYLMRDGDKLQYADFEIDGQHFMAMDGGPDFKFSFGNSVFVFCDNQAEVDTLWNKLTEEGEPGECGWLKDKYGLSWQIIPKALNEYMQDKNPAKVNSVREAMLKMGKIDIAGLKQAYDQG